MKSQWDELKDASISLRKSGQSIKTIHNNLGVPVSTLSGWLKEVAISEEQKAKLLRNKTDAWQRAHQKAADWHRTQKVLRDLEMKHEAQKALDGLTLDRPTLDLALSILLFSGGPRQEPLQISSSNPSTLRFVLAVLRKNYGATLKDMRFGLNLRADQNETIAIDFWSRELGVSSKQFTAINVDKRTRGTPTSEKYLGVCIIRFSSVAIQRKLRYLYNLFCEKITDVNLGT